MSEPKSYRGIMVSSTFSDLKEHRRDVIEAIGKLGFHANVMEISGAQADTDVIDTSIKMVRDSAAFVGVISHRYGQTPECPDRNPDTLSVSELEFNEAMRLGRPILLFIMGDDHAVKPADIERDPDKNAKLAAFRERAKKMHKGSDVERIYEVFNSREEFAKNGAIAIGRLAKALPPEDGPGGGGQHEPEVDIETALPPELRAVPKYLGGHRFVGRGAELNTLDDWCAAADPHPMLLFEAIGGTGKSMVTWTWLNHHAMQARDDWAGRFWFSFYEGGATMAQFCREALAYMARRPVKEFYKQKMPTLVPKLVAELEARPWLIVLDGLERILVAYHRIDAPQMRDEDVDKAEDQISNRDPRAAINPEDEELLRRLAAAAPSKVLVTSRLTPQVLINRSDMPVPGVRREPLPGLRPADAEALFRACGVSGEGKAIQNYLRRNCDCHPLVIGALAGLVNSYKPDPGNFDAWLADPQAGGKLGLADLDLTQSRSDILDAAIADLSDPDRRLLQTLSLLQGGADYATLKEFNPHLPTQPEEPGDPEKDLFEWFGKNDDAKREAKVSYQKARAAYNKAFKAWEQSPEVQAATGRFDDTLTQLERRGLLQYDHSLKRYDLHPVVRGVAAGRMGDAETGEIGGEVADYFSSRPHDPFEQAITLEDLAPGIQLVATLTRMGDFHRALDVLRGELSNALLFNLMSYSEALRLLRPFFPDGWEGRVAVSEERDQGWLLVAVGIALGYQKPALLLVERSLRLDISQDDSGNARICLGNIASILNYSQKQSDAARITTLALELAKAN